MKITVVSRSWPSNERSGVSLAAAEHVRMMTEWGDDVSIVGANPNVINEDLPVVARLYIPASGSGSLYAPAVIDRNLLKDIIIRSNPALVVVETWQTALTDAAVDVANALGLPVLMISHGVALHAYMKRPSDILRALAWTQYRLNQLPNRIARLSVITTLDETSDSPRFYDRDLANHLGIPVLPLVNMPVNWLETFPNRMQRTPQILVVGYFSHVKNQLGALQVMAGLPTGLRFLFVGQRSGRYYERCVASATELGLGSRVSFLEDNECDLAQEIANSLVVLSTSITEALPICLLEAMASGTPFVAPPVGAVPSIGAGIVAADLHSQRQAIISLINDNVLWNRLSVKGLDQYKRRFTRECVLKNLRHAVDVAIKSR
jgi:glycosyltransferase involved in cell wall biosynthesis